MDLVSESLIDHHQLAEFDCGKPELNLWLHNSALQAQRLRTCKTTVWHTGDDTVLGYHGLVAHVIQRDDLSKKVGRGSPDQIPAMLLARLALDQSLQGQRYGSVLLADALAKVVEASDLVAARFVVVDAIDSQAEGFYAKHGFVETPVAGRMVRKISDIVADRASR